MLSDNLAFRLSISHLLYEDNNTGFTIAGIFELNMRLQKGIKKFLDVYLDFSFVYFIPYIVFSEIGKANLCEPSKWGGCTCPA